MELQAEKQKVYDGSQWTTRMYKILIISETKSNSSSLKAVSFVGCSVSIDGIKPDDKFVENLESIKITANLKEIQLFWDCQTSKNSANKMLPLSEIWSKKFQEKDQHNKCFQSIKQEF